MRKGQKTSQTIKDKTYKTKLNKFISELNLSHWEEYADTELMHTNSKKRTKVITLREYYSKLKGGNSFTSLKKEGYDKHLLFFYNKLLKNEIRLSKEEFQKDYWDGISMDEISKKYNIGRGCVSYLRELYGIKRKGATFIKRKATEEEINLQQKELIYGSLMGDCGKMSSSSIKMKQSMKQKDYLMWKYGILKNLVRDKVLKEYRSYDARYDNWTEGITFYTIANTDIESIIYDFYHSGKKVIIEKILSNLTPFSVAVWYMDDGKIDWQYRSRKKGWDSKPSAELCTDSFEKKECELIAKWFRDEHDIECSLREPRPNQYRVRFNTVNTQKFINLVRPHIVPSMQYKVNYEAYLEKRGVKEEDNIISKRLDKLPLGDDFKALDEKEKAEWVECIFSKLRKHTFPYSELTEVTIDKFIDRMVQFDTSEIINENEIRYKGYPSSFAQYFHPHIYQMKNKGSLSAYEIFSDDFMLKDIITRCILSCDRPTKSSIRHEMRRYRGNKNVSVFPYYGSKATYDKYCSDNAVVLDFCAGFGIRAIGALSSSKVDRYIACEPNVQSHNGTLEMIREFKKRYPNNTTDVMISNSTAESFLGTLSNDSVDLVFTSPPYFDTEIYGEDNSQSRKSFSSYNEWINEWLFECVNKSMKLLRSGGKFALNIANCHPYLIFDDTYEYAKKNWKVDIHKLFISNNKSEPLLIIHKGIGTRQKSMRDLFE